ncbi:MAG: Gmad2 immunoglobulin-like domain-containing protein [bacterium]
MKKKIPVLVIACLVLVTLIVSAQNLTPVQIIFDGIKLESDVAPIIQDGRVLVPIRVIAEKFGADVSWDGENNTVQIITKKEESVSSGDLTEEIVFQQGFFRPDLNKLPVEITHWINCSREIPAVQERNYDGYRYVLITEGMKPTGGYGVEVEAVVKHTDKLEVKINSTAPEEGQVVTEAITYPFDLIIVEETELPLSFTDVNDPDRYFMQVLGMEAGINRPIVAASEWIKVFTPQPNAKVAETISLTGIANVFEGTVSYELLTEDNEVLHSGFTTAAMGDWAYFAVEIPVPEELETEQLKLQLYSVSMKDGSKMFVINIPLVRIE